MLWCDSAASSLSLFQVLSSTFELILIVAINRTLKQVSRHIKICQSLKTNALVAGSGTMLWWPAPQPPRRKTS